MQAHLSMCSLSVAKVWWGLRHMQVFFGGGPSLGSQNYKQNQLQGPGRGIVRYGALKLHALPVKLPPL